MEEHWAHGKDAFMDTYTTFLKKVYLSISVSVLWIYREEMFF